MFVEVHSQNPFAKREQCIIPIIERIVHQAHWSGITGIFALSTASGLLEILSAIESLSPVPSLQWLFGMDDCLTEPVAIELARSQGGIVRVVSLLNTRRRFHPKVLHFASNDGMTDAAIVGSANLTRNGLTTNAEAISILHAESASDVNNLRDLVSSLYLLGHEPTVAELDEYRRAYKAARPYHGKVAHLTRQILKLRAHPTKTNVVDKTDSASPGIDPTIATRCWIEVGKNTALGRELEIKAEQALFFGLHHSGGNKQDREFRLSDGSSTKLNFKYQGNAMWRLQMSNEVPEVRRGLRPSLDGRLGRSPYVAVFERTRARNSFKLSFVRDKSADYRRIKRDAEMNGTAGHTTTRQYGWS